MINRRPFAMRHITIRFAFVSALLGLTPVYAQETCQITTVAFDRALFTAPRLNSTSISVCCRSFALKANRNGERHLVCAEAIPASQAILLGTIKPKEQIAGQKMVACAEKISSLAVTNAPTATSNDDQFFMELTWGAMMSDQLVDLEPTAFWTFTGRIPLIKKYGISAKVGADMTVFGAEGDTSSLIQPGRASLSLEIGAERLPLDLRARYHHVSDHDLAPIVPFLTNQFEHYVDQDFSDAVIVDRRFGSFRIGVGYGNLESDANTMPRILGTSGILLNQISSTGWLFLATFDAEALSFQHRFGFLIANQNGKSGIADPIWVVDDPETGSGHLETDGQQSDQSFFTYGLQKPIGKHFGFRGSAHAGYFHTSPRGILNSLPMMAVSACLAWRFELRE